ncbi:hypothetical protein [Chitinimonas koreensis]|uniref:hypothetical protein n=1 Tax=Chitinimonas koreensis TaxID=356302 RepID=UPI0006859199|nr:hypothetical protein [Chitinimonas koreensis]
MSLIDLLLKLLRRGTSLSSLEQLVLDAVRARLPEPLSVRWDEQVRTINKVQRLPDGVEVNFYRMKDGRPSLDEALAFPNRTEELLIAEVRIELDLLPRHAKLSARVWCVKGFLFSIEYAGSSKYVEEALGMDPAPQLKIECQLKADLAATG